MAEDHGCPVCGKHFSEEEDYDNHKEIDHPEVKENYPEAFEQEPPYIPDGVKPDDEDKEEADEEGADEPLKKVDDLSEAWNYIGLEAKAKLFEGLGIKQGDAHTLAGLGWSELTKQVRTDASEAYAKEQDEEEEKAEEQEEDEEDKAYENFYNLEKNHNTKDYKKKLTCENCNILFENEQDLNVHYNDTHAPADEFELEDDEEDDYKVDPLPKGEGYDAISY